MRIVEWNCHQALARKWSMLVEKTRPDVAVVCEVSPRAAPPADVLSWDVLGGDSPQARGLALVGGTTALTRLTAPDGAGMWSLSAHHPKGFNVIGIWSHPPVIRGRSPYGTQVLNTLTAYEGMIRSADTVVAGDFNIEYGGDEDENCRIFQQVTTCLDELGLVSAYHAWGAIEHGQEPVKTHYFWYARERGFHIDFVWVPRRWVNRIRASEVGTYEDWVAPRISDHVPLVVDIEM